MSSEQPNETPSEPPNTTSPPMARAAEAPFDDPDADIVIRTSDNVSFRVHRTVLALVSPLFKEMFSLPQAQASDQAPENDGVVSITEDSTTLDCLLRFIHPGIQHPDNPGSFSQSVSLIEAMVKYQMESTHLFQEIVRYFISLTEITPKDAHEVTLKVLGTLWKHRVCIPNALIQDAARRILRISLQRITSCRVPEMDSFTVGEYVALLEYHGRCAAAIRSHVPKFSTNNARVFGMVGNSTYAYVCETYRNHDPLKSTLLPLENLDVLFLYMRNSEFSQNPYACADPVSVASLHKRFPDTGGWACGACNIVGCPSMLRAINRIFKAEVDSAVRKVSYKP